MRRYKCHFKIEVGEEVELDGDLFKHTVVVCKHQVGDCLELMFEDGAYLAKLVEVSKKTARLQIQSKRALPPLKKPYIHLVLANPKVSVLEAVVEKSVELGVKSIFLLVTERSFFKTVDKIKLKERRLVKIIDQALQQSDRFEKLDLQESQRLTEFLDFYRQRKLEKKTEAFFLYEKLGDKAVETESLCQKDLEEVYLLVGPEGGFSALEAKEVASEGFREFSLGQQILKVETACVAGVSILKSRLQVW